MHFITRQLFVITLITAVCSKISTAPAAPSQDVAGSPEFLHNIIIELENVLYKLKEFARARQTASAQKESQDKTSEIDLNELAAVLKSQQQQASSGSKTRPAADTDSANSDVSLREALEYLVGLAKQKKLERRDHDIPFPLNDRENK